MHVVNNKITFLEMKYRESNEMLKVCRLPDSPPCFLSNAEQTNFMSVVISYSCPFQKFGVPATCRQDPNLRFEHWSRASTIYRHYSVWCLPRVSPQTTIHIMQSHSLQNICLNLWDYKQKDNLEMVKTPSPPLGCLQKKTSDKHSP